MSDKKITQLSALTSVDGNDVVAIVDDPAGTPVTKKVTAANLATFVAGTSDITTPLAAKAPLASPTFTGTVVLPATTSIGDVSSTEIGYVDGVTSAIQTQLDGKVAASIVDAKGDLIVATADNTVTRLAVGGTNDFVLLVDSSTGTGLKWAAVPAPTITWESDQNILSNAVFS